MKTTNIKLPLAYGSHRQVLDADSNLAVQVCSGGIGIEAADELQDLIVRAVNSHAGWAKWIVQHGPGLPDHACAECVPGGDIVKAGFQCVYHEAVAALAAAEAA